MASETAPERQAPSAQRRVARNGERPATASGNGGSRRPTSSGSRVAASAESRRVAQVPRAHPEGRPRRARPRLHPRDAARPVAARELLLPRRGARPGPHPGRGPGAAGGQPLRRQPDARHARLHARVQHLLRRRAALLPARPQPGAVDARPGLPAQVRHGRRLAARTPTRRSTPAPRCWSTRAATTRCTARRWESAKVDFGGRKGFIRLALDKDVPIVPVVSIGGQETALFLSRGERLAKLLRLDKMFRLKVLPISLALAVGAQHRRHARPLPAAGEDHDPGARTPIDLREEFGETPTSTRSTTT